MGAKGEMRIAHFSLSFSNFQNDRCIMAKTESRIINFEGLESIKGLLEKSPSPKGCRYLKSNVVVLFDKWRLYGVSVATGTFTKAAVNKDRINPRWIPIPKGIQLFVTEPIKEKVVPRESVPEKEMQKRRILRPKIDKPKKIDEFEGL